MARRDEEFNKEVLEKLASNKSLGNKPGTQAELSGLTGIKQPNLSKLLNGQYGWSAENRNKVAKELGILAWYDPSVDEPLSPASRHVRLAVLMAMLRPALGENEEPKPGDVLAMHALAKNLGEERRGLRKADLPKGAIELHFGKEEALEYAARIAAEVARELFDAIKASGRPGGVCAVIHASDVEVQQVDSSLIDQSVRATCEELLDSIEVPGVFASEEARRDLAGYFRCCPVEPEREPPLYLVGEPTGARNAFEAAQLSGRLGPFVGRTPELTRLRQCWQDAQGPHGFGSVVLVQGEGGQGKSRLLYQFRDEIEPFARPRPTEPSILAAASYEDRKADAWYPIRVLLATLCGYADDDPPELKSRSLASTIVALKPHLNPDCAGAMIPRLTQALFRTLPEGYHAPGEKGRGLISRCQDDVAELLVARSRVAPTVVVVDDVQWADSLSLEALQRLSKKAGEGRLVLVLALRDAPAGTKVPMVLSRDTGWRVDHTVTLTRFNVAQVDEYVRRLKGPVPDEVARRVHELTGGIAFYVWLLAQVDDIETALQDGDDPLRFVHLTRLNRLPECARAVARIASASGQRFSVDLLRRAAGLDQAALALELDRIVEGGIIYFRRPNEYEFVHFFMRKAVYESILEADRGDLHRRIIDALIDLHPNGRADPSVLARHLEGSGQLDGAIEALERAGLMHLGQWALDESIADYQRALELNEEAGGDTAGLRGRELRIRMALGAPQMARFGYASQELKRNYDLAAALADDEGTSADLKFAVRRVLWVIAHTSGKYREAEVLVRDCERLIDPEPDTGLAPVADPGYLVEVHLIRGFSMIYRGEYAEARDALAAAVAQYRARPYGDDTIYRYSQDPLILSQGRLGWALWFVGEPDRAVEETNETLERAARLNHDLSRVIALVYSAWIYHFRDEPKNTLPLTTQAIEVGTRNEFTFWTTEAQFLEGWARARQGSLDEGIDQMAAARQTWRAIGAEILAPYLETLLIDARARRILLGLGRPEDGEIASLERAVTKELLRSRRNGEGLLRPLIHAAKAMVHATAAATEKARCQVDGRLRLAARKARRQGSPAMERWITELIGRWRSERPDGPAPDLTSPT